MKDLFRIHYSFYILVLLLLFMGYINVVFCFFRILFFHELGHLITIKLLGYKVKRISIYATGGVILTNIDINIESYKLFLISISGIVMQLLLSILPYFKDNLIFESLNTSLIIFNLLPIYPSDGYKIFLSLFEHSMSYSLLIKVSFIVSLIILFLIFIDTKNYIIFVTLYILNIKFIMEYRYYMEKFYLERYLYGIRYYKKRIVNNIENIYKCRNNYIRCGNILKEEKEYYSEKYAYFVDK